MAQHPYKRLGSSNDVVSLALEAELEECQRQIHSGRVSIDDSTRSNLPGRSFIETFESEFDRTTAAIKATEHSIESTARSLLLTADALARKDDCLMIDELRFKADELSLRILKLNAQTVKNADEFRRIAKSADAKLGTTLVVTTNRLLESDPWTDELSDGGLTVVLLSDIYSVIRDIVNKKRLADAPPSKDVKWVAPCSFERVTTKYWVKDQDLSQVVLASVTELPLLVYGRKGGRILDQKVARGQSLETNQPDTSLWTSLASPISSVYFDSPDMCMYSERIKRSEGAKLFRIRWYDKKPTGDEIIFLELKTHHEKWIGDKSLKERVGIREKDVSVLIDTTNGRGVNCYVVFNYFAISFTISRDSHQ
mmetsp:Transcript_11989/g.26157  ORF Transcript_11989/g.26157 Transcript_11989/m.26157 type:complete len:367 (+) Transcript_11989:54-1154(+)